MSHRLRSTSGPLSGEAAISRHEARQKRCACSGYFRAVASEEEGVLTLSSTGLVDGHQVVPCVCQEQTHSYRAALVTREQQHAVSVVEVVSNEDIAMLTTAVVAVQERADVSGTSDRIGLEVQGERPEIERELHSEP